MPTVALLHSQQRGVFVTCGNCRRGRSLDLLALIVASKGDVEIEDAWESGRFRCGACSSNQVTLHIDP